MIMAGHTLELLAPVGGEEQLEAALRYGADAVYFAATSFGMRASAHNFAPQDIADVVRRVHSAGARAYVTVNILVRDTERSELIEYLHLLRDSGVDAVIVADLGVLHLCKTYIPEVEIHVSTQMSVTNVDAARLLHSLGVKRVVLARELQLDEIAHICQHAPCGMEFEVFVHGSMCMAYSGRCLISNYLTDRDANRGACAQSCRWDYALVERKRPDLPFEVVEDGDFTRIMSAQDLCMIDHLDELCAAGVTSLKIEGRAKGAYYVGTVINAYRHVLDGGTVEWARRELETISHRPYSTGFFFGSAHQCLDHPGYERTCDWALTVESCEHITPDRYGQYAILEADQLVTQYPQGMFVLHVIQRNKFCEGDELEAIHAGEDIQRVPVHCLWRLNDRYPVKEQMATHAGKPYVFLSPAKVEPGDLVRIRRVLTS